MDGLLLDTEPLYQLACSRAASALGYTLNAELNRSLIGLSESASLNRLRENFGEGFSASRFRCLCAEHWEAYVVEHGITVKPGVLALLGLLETGHIPFAIATASHQRNAWLSLDGAGLLERFPTVVTGDQVCAGKPAPDIYIEAASRMGVAPDRCIAFEDSTPGLLAAVRAGMRAILVPDLEQPSVSAMRKALYVLPSLEPAHDIIQSLISPPNH